MASIWLQNQWIISCGDFDPREKWKKTGIKGGIMRKRAQRHSDIEEREKD